jgi:hypothetical protein
LIALLERLTDIASLGLAALTVISSVHPATPRILVDWEYLCDVWGSPIRLSKTECDCNLLSASRPR